MMGTNIGARIPLMTLADWASFGHRYLDLEFDCERGIGRLHKQALKTLADYALIKPFRKKWRLTPKGEKATATHSEKDAFYGTAAR